MQTKTPGSSGTLHTAGDQVLFSPAVLKQNVKQLLLNFLNWELCIREVVQGAFKAVNNEFSDTLAHERSLSSPEKAEIVPVF